MAAAVAAPANGSDYQTVYKPTAGFESVANAPVIRAQNKQPYEETPNTGQPPTYVPPNQGYVPDGRMVVPQGQDPFIPVQPGHPGAAGAQRRFFGRSGPRPYSLYRWRAKLDVGFMPRENVSRGLGDFGLVETDAELSYSMPVFWNWIFTTRPQFGLRTIDGPQTTPAFPTTMLPGDLYRFGADFQLHSPQVGNFSGLLGFTPMINSDLEDNLTSRAYFWDGRGVLFYHVSPHVTLVGGAAFWDRVNDRVVPIAGIILSPNDLLELRLVFPEPRISYYLGKPFGFDSWIYARAEYHVEAYEINLERTGRREQVEFEDWRALLGFRWNNGWVSSYVEAGWVFGRDVDYRRGTPGFRIGSGFIARLGVRF